MRSAALCRPKTDSMASEISPRVQRARAATTQASSKFPLPAELINFIIYTEGWLYGLAQDPRRPYNHPLSGKFENCWTL